MEYTVDDEFEEETPRTSAARNGRQTGQAERPARQTKQSKKILLLACSAVLLLAGLGAAYMLLQNPMDTASAMRFDNARKKTDNALRNARIPRKGEENTNPQGMARIREGSEQRRALGLKSDDDPPAAGTGGPEPDEMSKAEPAHGTRPADDRGKVKSGSNFADSRELMEALSEIKKKVDSIEKHVTVEALEFRLGHKQPGAASPDPALSKAVGDMTNEIRTLTQARDELQTALKAMERRVDELTKENSKIKAKTDEPAKNGGPGESIIGKWQILGLSAGRIVLQDSKGKIHNLGAGDTLAGIKILEVDLKNGNVKTSAGMIRYGGQN
jgi:chaperonin cofactor prefoldin